MFLDSWEENPFKVTSLIKGAFIFRKEGGGCPGGIQGRVINFIPFQKETVAINLIQHRGGGGGGHILFPTIQVDM